MENNKQNLASLNQEWKEARPNYYFVNDGILNQEVWNNTRPKIMFLLKESADDFTNIAENNTIDIRKGNGPHFWWNIAYWKFIVNKLHKKENPEYIETSSLPEAGNQYILNDIAYVNIKKHCENKTSTDDNDIITYAQRDKEYLIQQIDAINPNVIFCNNTTFKAYNILYTKEIVTLTNICYKHKNRLIINYKHPSYFQIAGGRETLFHSLKNSLTEIDFDNFNWLK